MAERALTASTCARLCVQGVLGGAVVGPERRPAPRLAQVRACPPASRSLGSIDARPAQPTSKPPPKSPRSAPPTCPSPPPLSLPSAHTPPHPTTTTTTPTTNPTNPPRRFIKWTQETFSAGGHKAELLPLLERCTRELRGVAAYRTDVRYLRVWIQYVSESGGARRRGLCSGLPSFRVVIHRAGRPAALALRVASSRWPVPCAPARGGLRRLDRNHRQHLLTHTTPPPPARRRPAGGLPPRPRRRLLLPPGARHRAGPRPLLRRPRHLSRGAWGLCKGRWRLPAGHQPPRGARGAAAGQVRRVPAAHGEFRG